MDSGGRMVMVVERMEEKSKKMDKKMDRKKEIW